MIGTETNASVIRNMGWITRSAAPAAFKPTVAKAQRDASTHQQGSLRAGSILRGHASAEVPANCWHPPACADEKVHRSASAAAGSTHESPFWPFGKTQRAS